MTVDREQLARLLCRVHYSASNDTRWDRFSEPERRAWTNRADRLAASPEWAELTAPPSEMVEAAAKWGEVTALLDTEEQYTYDHVALCWRRPNGAQAGDYAVEVRLLLAAARAAALRVGTVIDPAQAEAVARSYQESFGNDWSMMSAAVRDSHTQRMAAALAEVQAAPAPEPAADAAPPDAPFVDELPEPPQGSHDAMEWAECFAAYVRSGLDATDVGWLVGWFANAMMAQHNHALKCAASDATPIPTRGNIAKLVDDYYDQYAGDGLTREQAIEAMTIALSFQYETTAAPGPVFRTPLTAEQFAEARWNAYARRVGTTLWVGIKASTKTEQTAVIQALMDSGQLVTEPPSEVLHAVRSEGYDCGHADAMAEYAEPAQGRYGGNAAEDANVLDEIVADSTNNAEDCATLARIASSLRALSSPGVPLTTQEVVDAASVWAEADEGAMPGTARKTARWLIESGTVTPGVRPLWKIR